MISNLENEVNEQLTTQDIDILIESLDAWIDSKLAGEILGDILIGALVKNNDPDAKAHAESERQKVSQKREQRKALRQRTATILKGKLYQLQATADANGIIRSITA